MIMGDKACVPGVRHRAGEGRRPLDPRKVLRRCAQNPQRRALAAMVSLQQPRLTERNGPW